MTSPPIVYDVTRLVTRALNSAPNGIDRIDFSLARHFFAAEDAPSQALIRTLVGPRLARRDAALATIRDIEDFWREDVEPADDPVFEAVIDAICGTPRFAEHAPASPARLQRRAGVALLAPNFNALRRWALRFGPSPLAAPQGAVFFNASGFLLDKDWHLAWLARRPDVKPVFYVHDLLPIDFPEWFWPGEPAPHARRMRNICRFGAGVVTGSQAVGERLQSFAAEHGRAHLPICVARPAVAKAFLEPARAPERLAGKSYFVVCGTIEPRKNHLLLLNVWRDLAAAANPPKLVIVGKRGWLNANVVALLQKCDALRPHVIEAGGLSTPALRALLAGARALLAPSFAEGFGLPAAEAIAAKVPVIASDIQVFREIGGEAPDFVEPLDGLGWRAAIADYAREDSVRRAAAVARLQRTAAQDERSFFAAVDDFLQQVAG